MWRKPDIIFPKTFSVQYVQINSPLYSNGMAVRTLLSESVKCKSLYFFLLINKRS